MTLWKEKFFFPQIASELGKHSSSHVDQKYFLQGIIHRPIRSIHAAPFVQASEEGYIYAENVILPTIPPGI